MNVTKVLKNVRLSFSDNLVVAEVIDGGKPRFTSNFIIEDAALLKLCRDTVEEIAKAEFGGRIPQGKDCCLRDGNDFIDKNGNVYKGYEGNFYLSGARAGHLGAPLVKNGALTRDVRPGEADYPQSGDYVNAKVSFYSLNGKNDKGHNPAHGKKICLAIEVVQFVRKGEAFGAGAPTTDGMEAVEEEESPL